MSPLFGRRPDVPPSGREYTLRESPVVASDDVVVLVDLTVRFTPSAQDDGPGLPWNPANEGAVHAVVQTAVRLVGDDHPSTDLLAGRALVDDRVRRHLAYAPVPTGFTVASTSVEVRPHTPDFANAHTFRVVPP